MNEMVLFFGGKKINSLFAQIAFANAENEMRKI
jgi:hypothetical protein